MIPVDVLSDQYYKWSDRYAKDTNFLVEKEKIGIAEKTAGPSKGDSRVAYRAIQALWKARLPVCHHSGAWAKALSICSSGWLHPSDGLCTAVIRGRDRRILGELSSCSKHSGRNLSNQPGAIAAQGDALIDAYETGRSAVSIIDFAHCQYAGRGPPR